MEKSYEILYHEMERNHFWFRARRNYIVRLLNNFPREIKILDVGCSSGILINELQNKGFKLSNIYGIDISCEAILNCKKNGIQNSYVMDAENLNLPLKFDVIIASDCLEHLKNDNKALKNWFDLLKDNGILIVFVPAFMALWSKHDDANMHYRRYRKSDLKAKLVSVGYSIDRASYWNFFLFLPTFVFIKISNLFQKKKVSSNLKKTALLNWLLYKVILFENNVLSKCNFPIGISAFCVARKPLTNSE